MNGFKTLQYMRNEQDWKQAKLFKKVLELRATGMNNADIAKECRVSERMVRAITNSPLAQKQA